MLFSYYHNNPEFVKQRIEESTQDRRCTTTILLLYCKITKNNIYNHHDVVVDINIQHR